MEYTDYAEEKVQITEQLMVTLIIVLQFPTVFSRREGTKYLIILFYFTMIKVGLRQTSRLISQFNALRIKIKLDNDVSSDNLWDPMSTLRAAKRNLKYLINSLQRLLI